MRSRNQSKETLVRSKALEMLVQLGFDGFSMQKLAKAAGVSPATLYIYYKDKDDLIIQLGIEEGKKMIEATFIDFSPEMPFEEGLRVQWRNRVKYWLENPISTRFFEQIKHSPFRERVMESITYGFKERMMQFVMKAVKQNELLPLQIEVFWTIAFAPLYSLIRFHQEGKSIGGHDFTLSEDIIEKTFSLVIKALKP